jgi:endo-1,4-beta-xylanase
MFHYLMRKKFSVITVTILFLVLTCSAFLFYHASASTAITTRTSNSTSLTLGAAAAKKGRTFGAAISGSLLSGAQYSNFLRTQYTGLTPGNEMKWDTTEPSRGTFNFAPADAIVRYAQSHNMKVRGHTLVWYSQLPGWVSNITSSRDLLQVMNNHISVEAGHFKGKVVSWDVVNEAFNDNGTRRNSVFQRLIGNSYIEDAFKTARATDPHALLCYNDYNIEGINAKSNAVYNMVKDFKARGIPIDCVGFQSHLIVGQVPSDFQANLQRFAALGVTVQITELDIRMPTPATTAKLQQQAKDYRTVVAACLAVSRCNNITVWGVYDGDSWIPAFFPGYGAALLFDNNYKPKPAYYSVQALLHSKA